MFGEAEAETGRRSSNGKFLFILTTIILLTAAASIAAVFSFSGAETVRSAPLTAVGPVDIVASRPAVECYPAPSGMVGWWPGNGNANDLSGGNHGTLSGSAAYAPGKVDQAFSLDGSAGTHIALPDAASQLLNNTAGTIVTWVNPSAVGDNDIVAAFGSGNNGEGVGIGVWGNVRIYHHTSTYDWQSNTPISPNTWTFIAYTWDSTTERIYKNGVFSESRPRNFNYIPGSARIGDGFWNDPANRFPGLIDEVAIFNRTLSDVEVAAIFDAGTAGICEGVCTPAPPNMTAWWPGEGNANDIQGPTFENGTLQNGAGFGPGMVRQGFLFDGVDDHVSVPNFITSANTFSFDFWMKIDSFTDPHYMSPICQTESSFPPSPGYFCMYTSNEASSFGLTGIWSDGTPIDLRTNIPFGSGTWHHIALTYDGTTLKQYLDGQIHNQAVFAGKTIGNTQPLLLGKGYAYPGSLVTTHFAGTLDEVEFFERALAEAEIQAIVTAGGAGKCRECAPPPSGMTQWWPGEGNALDIQGPTFENGTLVNGAAFAPGTVGQAFHFDGDDDHFSANVQVPVGTDPNMRPEPFSVDLWMYAEADPGNYGYLVGKSHPDGWEGWDIRYDNSRISVFGVNGYDGTPDIITDPIAGVNEWHHVALSAEATGGQVKLYIDGELRGSAPRSDVDWTSNTFNMGWQLSQTGAVTSFNGIIDEVEIFDRAVSQADFQVIYGAGSIGKCRTCTPPPPNMISWWPGDGNTNDIVGGYNASWVNGGSYTGGKVAEAFNFDGVDDLIAMPNMPELDFGTGEFTVDFWARSPESGRRMDAISFLPDYPTRNLIFDFNDPDNPS